MYRKTRLSDQDIESIRKLARDLRRRLGLSEEIPIANDMYTVLDKLEIILLELPIEAENDKPSFSAVLLYSKEGGENLVFIGLNTADYFDKQIFAIAHELYHFYTRTGSHLSRSDGEKDDVNEAKADWFAAELLLPEEVLRRRVFEEFGTYLLRDVQTKTLLRFIVRLHCTWWLPYRSLVKRLWEIHAITAQQYENLYDIDERDREGEYYRIGRSTQNDDFIRLNTVTRTIGSSPSAIETILRNFENGLIDEDSFAEILGLFNKNPSDYGYEISVLKDDLDEISDLFEDEDHES
ncbi:MAG: ImmA/IrrE family metallo-endopeptidase [Sphaerochaetaceae bacterium]|nr:ImmA/IrrE family metallo-endopeptidase [Sphaerochaetaceae bacterium]